MPTYSFTVGSQQRTVTTSQRFSAIDGVYFCFESGDRFNMLTGKVEAIGSTDFEFDPKFPMIPRDTKTYTWKFDAVSRLYLGSFPDANVVIKQSDSKSHISVDLTSGDPDAGYKLFYQNDRSGLTLCGVLDHVIDDPDNLISERASVFGGNRPYKMYLDTVRSLIAMDQIQAKLIAPPEMTIIVWIPRSTDLSMVGVWNKLAVDEIGGTLTFFGGGVNNFSFEACETASLSNVGIGLLDLASVAGNVELINMSSGSIRIGDKKKKGHKKVKITSQGPGKVDVVGKSLSIVAAVHGTGHVKVGDVQEAPRVARIGTGTFSSDTWVDPSWTA